MDKSKDDFDGLREDGDGQPRWEPEAGSSDVGGEAERIRALGRAGHSRAEISKALGVRYQKVRYVLLRAGITGGLRHGTEAAREPVPLEAVDCRSEIPMASTLLSAGFRSAGRWTGAGSGAIALEAEVPVEPGVYAFAVDGVVAYVGLTANGLRARMEQYRRGHRGQRTNARVKQLIADTLGDGRQVEVLVATPAGTEWNGLPVSTAAGLEAGLIARFKPAWNILGAT